VLQHLPEQTFVLCTMESSTSDDQVVGHDARTGPGASRRSTARPTGAGT
jgi:hypothetical protein